MYVVSVEHEVVSYEGWKKAFDSDPINRKDSGVKRHTVYRPLNDPKYVVIHLEFEDLEKAKRTEQALQQMMTKVVGTVVMGPTIRLIEDVETQAY